MAKKATKKAKATKTPVPETKKKIKKPAKESKTPAKKEVKKIVKKQKQEKAKPTAKAEPKKQPKREKTKKKAAEPKGAYNEAQAQTFKTLKQELQKKSIGELKEMLKKNDQTCTGTKDELIVKIADGKVLGKIPRCPSCFGGRLRFESKTGVYNCPGYRDDTDFHNCHKKYQLGEITRDSWVE